MPPRHDGLLDVPPASDPPASDSSASDSPGLPWAGRALTSTGFDNDTGEADPTLLARLTDGSDEVALFAAMSGARLLVPIVAAPPGIDESGDLVVERSTDMSVVTLTSPDGQRALPVFSSLAALSAWDASARPSPVTSSRAAQAAVSERCDVLLLDAGSGHQLVLRPSMVWALAQQRDWLPAHTDPFVAQALLRATAEEAEVTDCFGEEGDPVGAGILRVVLSLRPGLDPAQVQAIATRVAEQIATDGEARARIDGLAFVIRPA